MVLGGVHVSVLPGEAIQYADAIVIGRGESAWPQLIRDFRHGRMKRVYRKHDLADDVLAGVPAPRRDLQRNSGYRMPNTIQATRGCRRRCDFCSVTAVWPRYLKRPVADVVRDLRATPGRIVAFNDVSLVDDEEYARELFTAMIPLKKKWGGLVTADSLKNSRLLDLMVESGCVYLLIGFESGDQDTLRGIRKGFNQTAEYKDFVTMLHRRGITIQGCLVFGFDHDDKHSFDATIDLVQELGIDPASPSQPRRTAPPLPRLATPVFLTVEHDAALPGCGLPSARILGSEPVASRRTELAKRSSAWRSVLEQAASD